MTYDETTDTYSIQDAVCLAEICGTFQVGWGVVRERIPMDSVHETSEIKGSGDKGTLVLRGDYVRMRKWIPATKE